MQIPSGKTCGEITGGILADLFALDMSSSNQLIVTGKDGSV